MQKYQYSDAQRYEDSPWFPGPLYKLATSVAHRQSKGVHQGSRSSKADSILTGRCPSDFPSIKPSEVDSLALKSYCSWFGFDNRKSCVCQSLPAIKSWSGPTHVKLSQYWWVICGWAICKLGHWLYRNSWSPRNLLFTYSSHGWVKMGLPYTCACFEEILAKK